MVSDSPALLNGPQELLNFLNIHIIGRATEPIEDELIVLKGKDNNPGLIILAVPYLRDRDIRPDRSSKKQRASLPTVAGNQTDPAGKSTGKIAA